MVALPEKTGLPLAVAGVVFLTGRVRLAEVAVVVGPALEAETAVAVHLSLIHI